MANYITTDTELTATANAIRSKTGGTSPIEYKSNKGFADAIESIPQGVVEPIKLNATYKNTTPAIAYGEIVLSASDDDYSGDYDIMWGDANGVMSNYSKIDTVNLDVVNNKPMASIELMEYNAIPKYATRIVAVKNGAIVCDFAIPNAKLWASGNYGEHLYSFGAISDVHIQYDTGGDDVSTCLTYLNERESVDAVCIAGDLTSDGTQANLEEWKTARDTYCDGTPVYSSVGNHEARNASAIMYSQKSKIRKYLDTDWQTGDDTTCYFLKVINDDVFIFLSIFEDTNQADSHTMFTADELAWLEEKLELYRNQRVFLFAHVPPHWNTVGIKYNGFGLGNGAYSTDIWGNPQVSNRPMSDRTALLNLIDHYKNVIWFSGHSHIKYEYQSVWENLNVMQYKGGARFVHLSSLTVPRDIINGSVSNLIYAESQGSVVDVYTNCIRVRSRNFVGEKFLGCNEYLIDTTPVTIPAKTKTLVSISATKTKTSYYTDETLSTADITVTATWSDSTTSTVDNADVVFNTSYVDLTTEGTYSIGISYTYGEDTETTSVQVTSVERPATKTLASISATKTTTAYTVNDTLSTSDIAVTATYSDNTTADVTASALYDTSNVDMTAAGSYTIGVSYTEDGVTQTTTVSVTVSSAPSVNPTVFLDATWTGTINSAGTTMTPTSASKGTIDGNLVYVKPTVAQGKYLYYRITDTAETISESDKVGFLCAIGTAKNGSTGGKAADYSLTASTWTKLTHYSTGDPLQLDSTNTYIHVNLKASSSSSAMFPVSVNVKIEIGYANS